VKSWLKQSLVFLLLAFFSAFSTYLIKGAYDRSVPCEPEELKEQEVCLKMVLELWKGDVVWVDARDEREKVVMLASAIEISEKNVEESLSRSEVMMTLFKSKGRGTRVVIFCQTNGCGSSVYVREKIISKGLQDPSLVYYLHGGWKAIEAEGSLLGHRDVNSTSH